MIIFHIYKRKKKSYINDLDRAELIYSSSKEEVAALGEYKLHQADLTNLSSRSLAEIKIQLFEKET